MTGTVNLDDKDNSISKTMLVISDKKSVHCYSCAMIADKIFSFPMGNVERVRLR